MLDPPLKLSWKYMYSVDEAETHLRYLYFGWLLEFLCLIFIEDFNIIFQLKHWLRAYIRFDHQQPLPLQKNLFSGPRLRLQCEKRLMRIKGESNNIILRYFISELDIIKTKSGL